MRTNPNSACLLVRLTPPLVVHVTSFVPFELDLDVTDAGHVSRLDVDDWIFLAPNVEATDHAFCESVSLVVRAKRLDGFGPRRILAARLADEDSLRERARLLQLLIENGL